LRCVPEGRCDRSLARSAWNSATPEEPSRRVRSDSCRCASLLDALADISQQHLTLATKGFQRFTSHCELATNSRFSKMLCPEEKKCFKFFHSWKDGH
jgi:hypothetical protein